MERRTLLSGLTTLGAVVIAGCSSSSDSEPEDEDEDEDGKSVADESALTADAPRSEIRDVIETHFRAAENAKRELLVRTLHPEAPNYQSTVETYEQVWGQYDLEYEYEIRSISVQGEEAVVDITQVTRGQSADFRDNRIEATWTFRVYEGKWRLYDSTTNEITYLD
jgi:hypothetical protein